MRLASLAGKVNLSKIGHGTCNIWHLEKEKRYFSYVFDVLCLYYMLCDELT